MSCFYLLTGLTGSGKSRLLQHLKKTGQQTLDLEAIAGHSGSAFGAINRKPLSSQKVFEQQLWQQCLLFSASRPVYMECKGQYIGNLFLPPWLMQLQQSALKIFIDTPFKVRLIHILTDYRSVTLQQFQTAFLSIENKMSFALKEKANSAIQKNNRTEFIQVMMEYFDNSPTYRSMQMNAADVVTTGHSFNAPSIAEQITVEPMLIY